MRVFLSGSWVYGCVDFSSDIDYVVFSPEVGGGVRGKGGEGGGEVKWFAKKLASVLRGKSLKKREGEKKEEGEKREGNEKMDEGEERKEGEEEKKKEEEEGEKKEGEEEEKEGEEEKKKEEEEQEKEQESEIMEEGEKETKEEKKEEEEEEKKGTALLSSTDPNNFQARQFRHVQALTSVPVPLVQVHSPFSLCPFFPFSLFLPTVSPQLPQHEL